MWREFNPNPAGRVVGDCAVRAVSVALGVSWETAFALIANAAFQMADMPSSNAVIGAVLRGNGFYRHTVPNECPDCYTAADFCKDHPRGVYVLGFGNHVATVYKAIAGRDPEDLWPILDEIFTALRMAYPRLYDLAMRKLQ